MIPFPMELPDRAPKERYYDPEFFRLETERLWPRTWQMACRLEEIPETDDFSTYEVLGDSIIVVRTSDGGVKAFDNTCRHKAVRLVEGAGSCASGFTCPFHGWCYGPDGANTAVTSRGTFADHNLVPADLDLQPVRCETYAGMAWITRDPDAPPLLESLGPFKDRMDRWRLGSMNAEWWFACRLPVNWKLAEEAFMEQYHVLESHPQLRIPGRMLRKDRSFDPASWVASELTYLRTMSVGMAGMVHATDVAIAEELAATIELPEEPKEAVALWHRTLNDAVTAHHRALGCDMPDINELEEAGINDSMSYCFPHVFVLPMYSSASLYRFRPLGPEETVMEIWSLTRSPEGTVRDKLPRPELWESDDPRWPPIPAQDFSNLPKQQKGLHASSFDYMRLSAAGEGGVSNFERFIDGWLGEVPRDTLVAATAEINVNPLTRPIVDLGF
jgi:phenylpropionate dioxygenase-like ring-hydroxylating dioxygenase large terminal subunit